MLTEIAQIIPNIKPRAQPFHGVPIHDCGEPIVPLKDVANFAYETPAPYEAVGAPYNGVSPFSLREGVAQKLATAQAALQQLKPNWRLKIFDAYRPIAVQAYMVALTFCEIAHEMKLNPLSVTDAERDSILEKVYRIWSPPNHDPLTPPPHSTGAAVDVTLVDEHGNEIDMGSPIDFNGDESNPDYFKDKNKVVHEHRSLLRDVMEQHGFKRLHSEWWHFSYGDQCWVWLKADNNITHAIYGRSDSLR